MKRWRKWAEKPIVTITLKKYENILVNYNVFAMHKTNIKNIFAENLKDKEPVSIWEIIFVQTCKATMDRDQSHPVLIMVSDVERGSLNDVFQLLESSYNNTFFLYHSHLHVKPSRMRHATTP